MIPLLEATCSFEGEWYTITCAHGLQQYGPDGMCGHQARFFRSFPGSEDPKYCEHINAYWRAQKSQGRMT